MFYDSNDDIFLLNKNELACYIFQNLNNRRTVHESRIANLGLVSNRFPGLKLQRLRTNLHRNIAYALLKW